MTRADRTATILTVLLLLSHAAGASVFLWYAPHGFPVSHARFWIHTALLVVVFAASLGLCKRPRWGASALLGFWVGAAAGFVLRFTNEGLCVAVCAGLLAVACALPAYRLAFHGPSIGTALVGLLVPFGLGAPAPSTHPGGPSPTAPRVALAPSIQITPSIRVLVDPEMSVHDGSRTGFQTIFGPGPTEIPASTHRRQDGTALVVEGLSTVPDGLYAHLSTYTVMEITGHQRLSVVFSPCPDTPFPVEPADYPWGRPRKIAYVTADRRFIVARARTAEKGPYTTLCEGRLQSGDPLTLTFFDEDQPAFTATWLDYSAQLSTALSPAAGYGLPQNALIFSDAASGGRAFVHLTLASTGIGIGWDSVGLTPGEYTNRIRLEPLGR